MSLDMGIVAISTYKRSLNQWDFVEFLKKIRKIYVSGKIGVYLDNASFHKANSVKEYANTHEIELIFSPVYSPEYQPCESLIGYLKQHIKKKRL
jgi:transposase